MSAERRDFMMEVWKFLLRRPKYTALLSSLAHPHDGCREVKQAWSQLQQTDSRLKKPGAMKTVMSARPDIFQITKNEATGHPLVALTTGTLAFEPENGLPDRVPHIDLRASVVPGTEAEGSGELEVDPAELAAAEAALATSGLDNDSVQRALDAAIDRAKRPIGAGDPNRPAKAKKEKNPALCSYRKRMDVNPWKPVWAAGGYRDIIWTPDKQEFFDTERRQEIKMVWALYEAVKLRGHISVAMLGQVWDVNALKKLDQFKTAKFSDIVKQFELVFELAHDGQGAIVKLTENAEAHLPELDERLEREMGAAEAGDELSEMMRQQLANMVLPDRVFEPQTLRQRLQALRIEIVHCLYRRGGRAEVQHLGQDYLVQQCKEKVHQGKKLLDFVKAFPKNFGVEIDNSNAQRENFYVTILDANCDDETGVEDMMLRSTGLPHWMGKGRGRGLTGKGCQGNFSNPSHVRMPPAASALYGPSAGYQPYMGGVGGGYSMHGTRI
jgi:hypothetical protein